MSQERAIADGLQALRIVASAEQAALLARHVELVYETNRELNLTAIEESQAVPMHVLDCAVALPYIAAAKPGPFADLGSGAGFPGIPLAILSGREVSLVESVRKKAAFLELAVAELRLKATVHPVRAEELAQERPEAFSAVTARALSSLPSLVELASPLLSRGGRLICLKARPEQEEVRRGGVVAKRCGMVLLSSDAVDVPGLTGARQIIVYEKVADPSVRLPRRNGMAQRQPLA